MRSLLIGLLACMPTVGAAQTLTAAQAIQDPRAYIGKTIKIGPIGCVDNPSGGFMCLTVARNQGFRLDASLLGEKTKQHIAEKLIGECKGTANLRARECQFDAEITPVDVDRGVVQTASGSQGIVVITSVKIDLFERGR